MAAEGQSVDREVSFFADVLDALHVGSEDFVILFRSYLDDSGSDDEQRISLVGGIFGQRERMLLLERMWVALRDHWKIDYFKASECATLNGQFEGWERERANECMISFAKVMVASEARGLTLALDRDLIRPVFGAGAYEKQYEYAYLATKYVSNLQVVFVQHFETRPELRDARVECFFDRQDGHGVAKFIMDSSEDVFPILGSRSWVNSKKAIPLQAADLLSWTRRRRCCFPDGKPTRAFLLLEPMHAHEDATLENFDLAWGPMIREAHKKVGVEYPGPARPVLEAEYPGDDWKLSL